MNVLDLLTHTPCSSARPPYVFIDACHTRACPSWRIGKRYGPCNCGAGELLEKTKLALSFIEVPDLFVQVCEKLLEEFK